MHKYTEWKTSTMDDVVRDVLMTLNYINSYKARDNSKAYSSSQLDDVKDCMIILHTVKHLSENSTIVSDSADMMKHHHMGIK